MASTRAKSKEQPVKAERVDKAAKTDKAVKPSASSNTEQSVNEEKTKRQPKTAVAENKVEVTSAEAAPDSDEQQNARVLLLADELDSGEEETADDVAPFKPGQDVGKIPTISDVVRQAAKPSTGERGVIYIGRIPHGFYEHEMRQYLSQFGPVTRVRLSRNKKTGASKHFAFVEFENETTAEIVTKTMDNYLLFGHILTVKMVPKSQVHEELFKGANRRFKKVPWNKIAGRKLAKPKTQSAWEERVERERARRAQRADKLKALGYEFEAPGLRDVPDPAPAGKPEALKAAPEGNTYDDEAVSAPAQSAGEEALGAEGQLSQAPENKRSKKSKTKSDKAKK